jgi:hypothetical protein
MRRLTIMFCAGLMLVAAASPSIAAKGGTDRPIKGKTSGTSTSALTPPATVDSSSIGTGNLSHLGKSGYQLTTSQDWSGYTPATPCGNVTGGSLTLTAGNGDTVTGTATGGQVCEADPPNEVVYNSTVNVSITGGTGRFTGATGALVVTGTSTATGPGTFADTGSMTGSISY